MQKGSIFSHHGSRFTIKDMNLAETHFLKMYLFAVFEIIFEGYPQSGDVHILRFGGVTLKIFILRIPNRKHL